GLPRAHADGEGDSTEGRRRRLRAVVPVFPVEDWRKKRPAILDDIIIPALSEWAAPPHGEIGRALGWRERLRLCFGVGGSPWDEEKVLDRYEMLYEAGLIEEARRDGRAAALARDKLPMLGEP